MTLATLESILDRSTISPYKEAFAWEQLYMQPKITARKISKLTLLAGRQPTEALGSQTLFSDDSSSELKKLLEDKTSTNYFDIVVNGTSVYPSTLENGKSIQPILYTRGDVGLLDVASASIVGSRKATEAGLMRAARAARELIEHGIVVTTGLARGIDTAAAAAALDAHNECGVAGAVIGVIGTPIDEYYPPENKDLQERVARQGLVVSQVPFYRYKTQDFKSKRCYFTERNELMAALSAATIIIEATDIGGALTQARACLQLGRPLFLAKSLFSNSTITWPEHFLSKGSKVFVLEDIQQVVDAIKE